MKRMAGLTISIALFCGPILAQTVQPGLPTAETLAEHAARRFPQPVRVGDLIGRDVLQPEEAQHVLGRVQSLTRRPDGGSDIVISEGTIFGLGGRPVSVPIEAIALLGEYVVLMDYTPRQLASLPSARPGPHLLPDETIEVGLVKPFH